MQAQDVAVVVPLLLHAGVCGLHDAHSALAETPSKQALPAEIARGLLVQSVELSRGIGLARNVECLGSLCLHAKGQFKGLNPGLKVRI